MTETQIKYMVNRFLGWRLPEDFAPDAGISFKPEYNENTPWPAKHEPVGTNLLNASQAEAMVRYIVDGLLDSQAAEVERLRRALDYYGDGAAVPGGKSRAEWMAEGDAASEELA